MNNIPGMWIHNNISRVDKIMNNIPGMWIHNNISRVD